MSQSRLIELSYYDPKAEVRLTAYADTLVLDEGLQTNTMTAIRFGGYPEMVNAMATAIHGGAVIDATIRDESIRFQCIHKGYTKQLSHDGVYATATLMANDEAQEAINTEEQEGKDTPEQPRTCYIFCPAGDRNQLFEEIDCKTAAPLIPEFQDQILDALIADGSLRQMKVYALKSSILNSLLAALNERRYTNEGHTYNIPVIAFFTASNEIPNFADPQEKSLEALYDRLQIKVVTEDIGDRGNRLALLRKKQSGGAGQILSTITLDELLSMQQEVKAVTVPDSINELADDILCELRRGGISVSDRKYLNFAPLAQAKAWLEGHGSVQAQDMLVLRNYLWQKPGDRTAVDAVLNRLCVNPMQTKVEELARMALDAQEDFQAAKAAGTGSTTNKALIKLRAELIRLYRSQQELNTNAQSDSEKAMVASLLDGLEQISRSAHEEAGFTYAPLAQLEALQ